MKKRFPLPSRGAALVIALTFLVLLSAIVLALFVTVRTDQQNAGAFASGQETLRLAETAVNIVQGQVRDATIQPRVGWASQPGMVRSFDTSGNVTAYKLYSSDNMVVSGFGTAEVNAEVAAINGWNTQPALFTDLNEPAVVKRPDPANASTFIATPVFPIADPAVVDTDPTVDVSAGAVEGFSAATTVPGTSISTAATRRLPMPVKWIYVLRDGKLAAPSGGSGGRASFSGSTPRPDQTNPIVGRIAFWADDDTCKLNINTASEGSFWDVPKATTWSEVRMSIAMPVRGEFQRLVGHPSTTSLSPVLKSLSTNYEPPASLVDATSISSAVSNPDGYYAPLANYYALTPRIAGSATSADESSKGGAQRTSATGRPGTSEETNTQVWPASDQSEFRKGSPLIPDSDRLYATSDELLFKPDRTPNLDLNAQFLSQRSFFLTAQNRAPETTLFGTPRVSLWPQQTATTDRTVKDRLIDFCSRIGNFSYSFQRGIASGGLYVADQPADSPTADVDLSRNQQLFNYVRSLSGTQIPGYGRSFFDKWGAGGADKVLAQVFDTVRANTNSDYLSFGSSSDRVTYRYSVTTADPQVEIRPGNNGIIDDKSAGPRNYVIPAKVSNSAMGMGRNVTISQIGIVFMASKVRNNYADGRYEVSDGKSPEVFNSSGSRIWPTSSATSYPNLGNAVSQVTLEARAFLIFQPYLAAQGTPSVVPGGEIEIQGLNSLRLNGTAFVTSTSTAMRYGSYNWQGNRATGTSDSVGSFQIFANYAAPRTGNMQPHVSSSFSNLKEAKSGGGDKDTDYPFVSPSIPVTGPTVNFTGGNLTVILKSWKNANEYQRLSVSFPDASFVMPQHVSTGTRFSGGKVTPISHPRQQPIDQSSIQDGDLLDVRNRLVGNTNGDSNSQLVIRPGDVVCAVEWAPTDGSTRGDFRLLAISPTASTFASVSGYGTASNPYSGTGSSPAAAAVTGRFAHSMRSSSISQYINPNQYGWKADGNGVKRLTNIDVIGATSTLVPGISFNEYSAPVIPAGFTGGARMSDGSTLGDWQSGIGANVDGAFFPRSDSGDTNKNFGGYFGDKYLGRVGAGDSFEPNRSVPSAGELGALVTANSSGDLQPWQTLLFNPRPAGGSAHPGFGSPPDHLYLDNYWMPVVEPFPISDPLSTAGKVNLNFQMMPFVHIERSTALRGALKPLMLSAVEDRLATGGKSYKYSQYIGPISDRIRYPIDRDETVKEFEKVFAAGDIFRSATQVSAASIVPEGQTGANLGTWWGTRRLTSDTLREQPYLALLSRVTTKSNTYTVHYRVQALRQTGTGSGGWNEWDEARDAVVGEYRGATTIERFLDTNAPDIPDYTQVNLSGDYVPIDRWYRWRVLSTVQFAP